MVRLDRAIRVCMIVTVLAQNVSAYSATYYVDMAGNDSNPGTEEKPWRSVAYAVDAMLAGDTTYVKGGIYNEGVIRFKSSGTKTAPIKLLSYPEQSPIINCIDPTQYHRILLENRAGYKYAIGWIAIEGFEIRNCYNGLKFSNLHDSIIRRNWIHDSGSGGLVGNGTRILIDRNVVSSNGSRETPNHGLYMAGTAYTITNNLIYDNYNYGIQLNGSSSSYYDPAKHAGPEFAESHDWVIANNTFAYNRKRGGIVVWGSTCQNARIENNIFYENGVALSSSAVNGIDFVSTGCSGIQIRNNLSYASGGGATVFLSTGAIEGVHYMQSGNIVNKDNPGFVNAPETLPILPNFALADRSPAIDKGLPIAETATSFNGLSRPRGRAYDMGAYEYDADGDAQSPKTPTSLKIH